MGIAIESQEDYLKIGLRRVLKWQEYQGESLLNLLKVIKKNSQNSQTLVVQN